MQYYGITTPPPVSPLILITALAISSLTINTIFNSIPAFGEEYGWRGFLLPKLMPLGKNQALIISGLIWGLWHVPFIVFLGFHYTTPILGSIVFVILVTLIGIYFGDLALKNKNCIICPWSV